MAETPRQNDRLLQMVETTYDTALFSLDNGMWTIFEIVKRPIAQAPSKPAADALIERLKVHP
ncbi:hypothetical protein EN816_00585 [Mesorhizobium sp. M8A.F.Ca.ET.173.01.1.1]|nr:hypothetical protein EN816_00585 [Mesorhizobium sp. M8A.F.Ca.ET.173.01.1.1]